VNKNEENYTILAEKSANYEEFIELVIDSKKEELTEQLI